MITLFRVCSAFEHFSSALIPDAIELPLIGLSRIVYRQTGAYLHPVFWLLVPAFLVLVPVAARMRRRSRLTGR